MGIKDWQETRLITHGRDHKLRVWQVPEEDLNDLSTVLPADAGKDDDGKVEERQPWLIHSMDVNALNFCAFAVCEAPGQQAGPLSQGIPLADGNKEATFQPILLAAPNGLDQGGIDIFHLPSEQRISKLQGDQKQNTGMVMSLRIFKSQTTGKLTLIAGFEDGSVYVYAKKEQNVMPAWIWEKVMAARPHKQPVLSLDVLPGGEGLISSSADAVIARFAIPGVKLAGEDQPEKLSNTKHAGQQDLKIRSDGRVFATAGWDKNVRVYSVKTLKELAVLQWHQEGCYAIDFADMQPATSRDEQALVARNAMDKMKQERDDKVHGTHWLVAGSKDGKISLWDVY